MYSKEKMREYQRARRQRLKEQQKSETDLRLDRMEESLEKLWVFLGKVINRLKEGL